MGGGGWFVFLMIRRPPRSTLDRSSAASDVYKRQVYYQAVDLFGSKRDEFQKRIFETISKDFTERGLMLEQLLVRNITLPATVKLSLIHISEPTRPY